ncbi:MAG: MSMEG_0567/Sll0786 family nitrogen starvation N-acetyltransferase [Burkholderiaceae bacterium]|jgi:putative N-acetyltransferase (TIGR04045 family)
MLDLAHICELSNDFSPCEFRVKLADSAWEIDQARRLRRAVFCIEQGVFVGDDRDSVDEDAQLLVAVSYVGGMADQVVGVVRIHQAVDGLWWGSRLAVHPAFRQLSHLGTALIRLAVSLAHARGAQIFLAYVQSQNCPLFEKLHWRSLNEVARFGRPHCLMQADLLHYPPCHDPLSGYVTQARKRA